MVVLRYGPAPVRALGIPLLLFLAGVIVFGAVAGPRLLRPSPAPHFVIQADAWLRGELEIRAALRRR